MGIANTWRWFEFGFLRIWIGRHADAHFIFHRMSPLARSCVSNVFAEGIKDSGVFPRTPAFFRSAKKSGCGDHLPALTVLPSYDTRKQFIAVVRQSVTAPGNMLIRPDQR
jgi:hypothetical protein